MSGRLVGDVFANAPEDLRPAEFLVLLALAEDARDRDRISRFGSDVNTLAYKTRQAPGTVRNALSALVERGLIRPLLVAHRGVSQEYELAQLATHHRFSTAKREDKRRHARPDLRVIAGAESVTDA